MSASLRRAMPSVMTSRQAAYFLSFSSSHVRRLARQGELPGHKLGGEWFFARRDLEQYTLLFGHRALVK